MLLTEKDREEVEDVRKSARTQIPPLFDNDPIIVRFGPLKDQKLEESTK